MTRPHLAPLALVATLATAALASSACGPRPCRDDDQCEPGERCDIAADAETGVCVDDEGDDDDDDDGEGEAGEGEGEAGEGEGEAGEGEGEGEGEPVLVEAVDTGIGFACVLDADRNVQCFGNNQSGQLGRVTEFGGLDEPPAVVPGLALVEDLAVAQRHACAIGLLGGTDRTVVCWGDGSEGTLGQVGDLGDATLIEPNLPVSTLRNAVDVDADGSNNGGATCVVDDAEEVWCWGPNIPGYDPLIGAPVQPAALQGATEVLVDVELLCARVDGSWRCLDNTELQEGADEALGCLDGEPCATVDGALVVDPGIQNTCVLAGGAVSCAGENDFGVVDPATRGDVDVAALTVVDGIAAPIDVAVGTQHACALEADGRAVCWGRTLFLSTGYPEGSPEIEDCVTFPSTRCHAPLPVPGAASARRFSDLVTRNTQSCARESNGEGVVCWGNEKEPFRVTFTSGSP